MNRLPYRNFGTHEALVASHTVDKGAGVAGARWYEIRGLQRSALPCSSREPSRSTTTHIWMPSIGQDNDGNILLLVNGSNATTRKPSLGFTGREPSHPPGMLQTPQLIINGTGVQHQHGQPMGRLRFGLHRPGRRLHLPGRRRALRGDRQLRLDHVIATIKFNTCN